MLCSPIEYNSLHYFGYCLLLDKHKAHTCIYIHVYTCTDTRYMYMYAYVTIYWQFNNNSHVVFCTVLYGMIIRMAQYCTCTCTVYMYLIFWPQLVEGTWPVPLHVLKSCHGNNLVSNLLILWPYPLHLVLH